MATIILRELAPGRWQVDVGGDPVHEAPAGPAERYIAERIQRDDRVRVEPRAGTGYELDAYDFHRARSLRP